ncbi:MAG: Crp/Fnr family transcriptional regulator [Myxococcota bacterium]|jgi:CRP-like cAMP-binding protein|nr:Crp/Fnr family transcriptional regulator [Myxococcota bacterium]
MASISHSEKNRLLRASFLFKELEDRDIDTLASAVSFASLNGREELFHQGSQGSRLYIVVRGRLKVLTTSSEGDEIVFNILGPGEVIGELAILNDMPRTATVRAIEVCELLSLHQRDLLAFLEDHPGAGLKLARVLARRVSQLSELLSDMQFLNLPYRLAKKMTALAHTYGSQQEGGLRIKLRLSQEEWGDLVGATRESVNKQFRAWTKEGLIHVDRGCVVLDRPDEIERLGSYENL